MTLAEIMEFILLPAVGWLLMNSNANQRRLTRIETLLETLSEKCPECFVSPEHQHKNKHQRK